jgi:hypothetical protein
MTGSAKPNGHFFWTPPKVGGHLAGNFPIHNSFVRFVLKHNPKVGGQLVDLLGTSPL